MFHHCHTSHKIKSRVLAQPSNELVSLTSAAFSDFLLKPELLRAIDDCGFEHPSKVQHECIPQAILGNDLICQAQSGMGKTAVFVLTVLHQIDPENNNAQCVVVCHTRELAYQICSEFERFIKYMPKVKVAVCYGGIPISVNRQLLKQEKPQIIVGTPGRLKAIVSDKSLDLSHVRHFVMDEADKLMEYTDMRADVQKIFVATPHNKQVMMFSATYSAASRAVCAKFMKNPHEILVTDEGNLTLHGIRQYFVELGETEKNNKLLHLLTSLQFNQVVIFVKSTSRCTELRELMIKCDIPTISIHGRLAQKDRIRLYKLFKNFQARILVATDLVGRGIDIQRVNVVINYDMPVCSDTYLHRVGRAGRFGTKGVAISFVSTDAKVEPTIGGKVNPYSLRSDRDVLDDVQSRFMQNSKILPLPSEIDVSEYVDG